MLRKLQIANISKLKAQTPWHSETPRKNKARISFVKIFFSTEIMTAVVVTNLAMDTAQKMESSVTGGPVLSTLRVPLLSEWITFLPLTIA